MRPSRLISNANFILNSNNFQNNFHKHIPNILSLPNNNNENNKSNLSITTNASNIKINSSRNCNKNIIPTSPKFNNINFDKKLHKSGSLPLLSPVSSRSKQHQLRIMEEADDLIRNRYENKNIMIGNSKKYLRHPAIKLKKDISLKNYIINLLKKKRTEINDKERMMNNALIEFTNQFNNDYKTFMEYADDVKKKQKLLDDLISKLKHERQEKEEMLNAKMLEYKRLEDYNEKILKLIYSSNKYAIFFHKVFEIPFNYNNLPELNRNFNPEEIVDFIINIYEVKDKNVPLPSILKDDNIIIQKYIEMEDIILHMVANRDIIVKENQKSSEFYEREIKILENSYKEYEKDLFYLKEELNILKKSMKDLKVQEPNEIDDYIEYIIELGKEIMDKVPKKNVNNTNNNGYLLYCRKVLSTLEEIEININRYINEIETILNYGEDNDKTLVENCILEIKKINKKENQLKLMRKKEIIENERKIRYMKRSQRMVVKGRQASPIFPLIKHVRKIKKLNINKNDDGEIECVYSLTDEEDKY